MHIVIVTIGILIALWFDGIKERGHERQLVREARENFRLDVDQNLAHLKAEAKNLDGTLKVIAQVLASDRPGDEKVTPSFYFFRATSWDTALSTGALAHMKPEEVVRYAEMHEAVKTYADFERSSVGIYLEYVALASAGDASVEGVRKKKERLSLLQQYLQLQRNLVDEFAATLEAAKKGE